MGKIEIWQNLSLTDLDGEKWSESLFLKNRYLISNKGRVKRKFRIDDVPKDFKWFGSTRKYKEMIMRLCISKRGYVKIHQINKKNLLVHRLVAIAFIPNPKNKPEINHINRIPWDNRVENLEWCTHTENMRHSSNMGVYKDKIGEKAHRSKLKRFQVVLIKEMRRDTGKSAWEIRKELNLLFVCPQTINSIILGKNWKEVIV